MNAFRRISLSLLGVLAVTTLASCGSEDPLPKPELEKYEGKFNIVKEQNESYLADLDLAHLVNPKFTVKNGNEETSLDVNKRIQEGQSVNLTAKTFLEAKDNITHSKAHVTEGYQLYYVLTGFRQFYKAPVLKLDENGKPVKDEKGKPVFEERKVVYKTLQVELKEIENENTKDSITNAVYAIDYPDKLKDGIIDETDTVKLDAEEKKDSIYLDQYIEPIYKLHFFMNNDQLNGRIQYTTESSAYLSPAITNDPKLLDPVYLQGKVSSTVIAKESEEEVPVPNIDLGFDLGEDGLGTVKLQFDVNPEDYNDIKNVDFDSNKKYNITSLVGVEGATNVSGNTYTAEITRTSKVAIKLAVEENAPAKITVVLQHDENKESANFAEGQKPGLTVTTSEGYRVAADGKIYNGEELVTDKKLEAGTDILKLRAKKYLKAKSNDTDLTTYYVLAGFKLVKGGDIIAKLESDGGNDFTTAYNVYTIKAPDTDDTLYPHYVKLNVTSEDFVKAMVSFNDSQNLDLEKNDEALTSVVTVTGNAFIDENGESKLIFDNELKLSVKVTFEDGVLIDSDSSKASFETFADENNSEFVAGEGVEIDKVNKTLKVTVNRTTLKVKISCRIEAIE